MVYRLALLLIAGLFVQGCSKPAPSNAPPSVTLYSSVDDYLLQEIVDDFEAQTGIKVRLVGDTEATKTTGLMHRLIAERNSPKADVWWSSEPFATERLAREGVLAPMPRHVLAELPEWPAELLSEFWVGFALCARVLAIRATDPAPPPTSLAQLTDPQYKGRVGIARPEFGTTRGHMAALYVLWGPDRFEQWLTAMRDNGMRVYSSNSAVVRAIAQGEISVGLTDTDDVWAAQRNMWPVDLVYERVELNAANERLASTGPMLIPNTVALVKDGPDSDHAVELIEFLLSERVSEIIASSDSHNLPVRPEIRHRFKQWGPPMEGMELLLPVSAVTDAVPPTLEVLSRVLGDE